MGKVAFFRTRPEGCEGVIGFVGEYEEIRCILRDGHEQHRDNITSLFTKLNYEYMVVPWWRYDMKICK